MTTEPHPLDIPPSLKREPPAGKAPVRTAAATKTKKPPAKKTPAPKATPKPAEVVTLKALCAELKINPYDARVKLRAAVRDKQLKHEAGSAWEWPTGSDPLATARKVLAE